jgi:restriction endonuclease S subunit
MAERRVALADCGRWLSGGTPATEEPRFWGGPIPWITASSLKSKSLTSSGRTLTPEGARAGSRIVPAGTLIFVVRGMSLKKEFRVGIAGTDVAFGQDCKALMPRPALLPEYLYYALIQSSDNVLRRVDESSHGTGRLETKALGNVKIRIPPLAEQRRIAEILDTLDDTIRSIEFLIAKLEQLRQGLMHDLLARGIGDSGDLRDPRCSHDGFPDARLGSLPEGWLVEPLGRYLVAIEAGDSPDVPDRPATRGEWGVLKVSAVRPYGFQAAENKAVTDRPLIEPKNEVRDGDLLITRANTPQLVGLACIVTTHPQRLLLSDKTLRLIVNEGKTSPDFTCLLLQSHSARAQIQVNGTGSSGSMKNISQAEILALLLPWPPPAEQRRICERFRAIATRIREEVTELKKLQLIRQGLMDDLLMGRVRVKVENEDAA